MYKSTLILAHWKREIKKTIPTQLPWRAIDNGETQRAERICLTTMENLSKDSFKGLDVMTVEAQ